jgi:hypothetical protein
MHVLELRVDTETCYRIATFPLLQKMFWSNSGMGKNKDIPELDDVPYRFHVSHTPKAVELQRFLS